MFQILQIFVCTLSVESFNDVFDGVDPNSRVLRRTPDEVVWDTVVFVLDEVEYAVMPGSLEIKSARRPIWKIRFNPLNYIIRGIARGGCGGWNTPPPTPCNRQVVQLLNPSQQFFFVVDKTWFG